MDYDNVKLPLKKTNKQINSLELVKARAQMRTKRRILEMQEDEKMAELERQVVEHNLKARDEEIATPEKETAKKGK